LERRGARHTPVVGHDFNSEDRRDGEPCDAARSRSENVPAERGVRRCDSERESSDYPAARIKNSEANGGYPSKFKCAPHGQQLCRCRGKCQIKTAAVNTRRNEARLGTRRECKRKRRWSAVKR